MSRLGDVFNLVGGGTPTTSKEEFWGSGTPWISSADIDVSGKIVCRRRVTPLGVANSTTNVVPRGTVIVVTRVGLGKVAQLTEDTCFSQDIQALLAKENTPTYNSSYLMYQLLFIMKTVKYSGRGTTISGITKKQLADVSLYLPPLAEQERIVARIEELFSQLDAGVETLKKTKAQLAVYRQAVLKEAFEGRLTTGWRKEHSNCSPVQDYESIATKKPVFKDVSGDENEIHLTLPDTWIKLRMGDVFSVEVGATPSRRVPEYWNGTINWVSSGEVHFNHIFHTDECITEEGLAHSSTNLHPIGTVMLAMIGEGKTRGQAAILEIPAAHNQNTAAILVSATPCDPKYIYYFLLMNYENTRRVGSGNNQKALNKERVRALRFPFTSFAEQHVIVEAIESRLSVCDSIEQAVDSALNQADSIRQIILKLAFGGDI